MKVLIDTCVIVDYLEERAGVEYAEKVLSMNSVEKYISAKSILDLYYLIHHFTHSNQKTLEAVRNIINIVDDVVDTTAQDIYNALSSKTSDYEDAVMIETAKRIGVDAIVTDNIKDYKYSSVKVINPKIFVRDCNG